MNPFADRVWFDGMMRLVPVSIVMAGAVLLATIKGRTCMV